MERRTTRFSTGALAAVITVAVIVMLPLFAVFVFVTRFALVAAVIVAAIVGGLIYAVSPRVRDWLGFKLDPDLTYSGVRLDTGVAMDATHCWARFNAGQATVGADDLVQQVLGPVDSVDLPRPGDRVRRGDQLFRLVHGERDVTIRSPVSGTVVSTNRSLRHMPKMVNEAPFGGGWVALVECDDARADKKSMFRGAKARAWFRNEIDRLLTALEPDNESPVLPDGGRLVWNLHRQIDDETWQRVRNRFFTPHDHVAA